MAIWVASVIDFVCYFAERHVHLHEMVVFDQGQGLYVYVCVWCVPIVNVWGMMSAVNDYIVLYNHVIPPVSTIEICMLSTASSTKAPTLAIAKYNKILVQVCYYIWLP